MDNKTNNGALEFKGAPQSYWMASTNTTNYKSLKEDIKTDVVIIGGGITGITCAYMLIKEGFKVAILEADRIAQGTTGHTTAKITSQHDLIYNTIKNTMSSELARQYAEANETAIHTISSIIKEHNIECDFSIRPAYVYTQSDDYIEKIQKEVETASELGIKAFYEEQIPLPFSVKAAMRFDNQAQFHPRKYLLKLVEFITEKGCAIYENTRVVDIEKGELPYAITKDGHKAAAPRMIIASHFPCYDGGGFYFARIYPEKSYALGVRMKEKFPEAMFINAEDPTRSLRSQSLDDGELVIIGGEHHKTGHGDDTRIHYENLRTFAESSFTIQGIDYRWSTQDCMPIDKVPYVGHLTSETPNIYVATGFKKWGMTNSTVSAMIIRDLIIKGDNPWAPVYNPSRFTPTASMKNFIVENADVAKNYVGDKLEALPTDVEIAEGEAKVFHLNGERVGAYHDKKGKLHMVDTTCTHLGCELHWNSAEKSWDCPCHGSRFTYEGDIIEGPAVKPLNHPNEGPNKINPNIF